MNALLLPGRTASIRKWAQNLTEQLASALNGECQLHEYQWWQDPDLAPDPLAEVNRLPSTSVDLVVAKSIGTLIAAKALTSHTLKCQLIVLIGIPVNGLDDEGRVLLQALFQGPVPVLVIQQEQDIAGSAEQVHALLTDRVELQVVSGHDHLYSDVDKLVTLIMKWLQSV
ncbi:alpha/beta family hydrolase [Reinekea blandensis]|uniref:KANL3/Tex30 alpha/beta hydrolase-like domain-containing protein n=1 Tax=Reinekea blandensis MED297 TaxID=314283 RepID=A4BKM5_9GAMM|nr:alpha/beta family hydrolase [Reinekea blandensis]EAR07336.1 hypothetical protein MED297_18086 [Reinekea sp. MED297] [Reinekea blandensis MED297]